ncbi:MULTISPECIES: aminotransferase class V-fold PLP-dependent enzyme [Tessaracoccus]|uniref:aminotransferase class V-fold PLP-dependent enzyme n=1 Tax=Tessaracoccus TaxID=72763 RepID=UPI00099DF66A|nr:MULTISPECIES: aminotransferase class V-fold PLP-dependent enzyme [Tessaracoccus]AQX15814.1 penicillin epimerase [Tessaracoccus sp. T2.5-30]VEP40252.1 Isopenicillin N epimerase [Tessaracoccus lapidicaptus]
MTKQLAEAGTEGTLGVAVEWLLDPSVRHLNHGSFGAVPEAVGQEQDRLRREVEANPVSWFSTLPERVAEARVEMAHLIGAPVDRTAFVLNASAGASVVFDSLACRGPVDVMTTNHGYGAVTMGAQRLAGRSGGSSISVEIPLNATAGEVRSLIADHLERHRPTLLVIDQVTSATARAFPTADICRDARELGVLTLVDGAHTPGVLANPVEDEADYWVGNLHKFACAPRGAAMIVTRGDGQELFPSIDSWGSPYPYPERFDTQGTLDLTQWLTAPFAWRFLDRMVGWDEIRANSQRLLDRGVGIIADALDGLVDEPVPDVGQPVGPMRLLGLPQPLGTSRDAADSLRVPFIDATGCVVAFTSFDGRGYLRLSAHLYTTVDDFQYLAEVGIPLLHRWSSTLTQGTP